MSTLKRNNSANMINNSIGSNVNRSSRLMVNRSDAGKQVHTVAETNVTTSNKNSNMLRTVKRTYEGPPKELKK